MRGNAIVFYLTGTLRLQWNVDCGVFPWYLLELCAVFHGLWKISSISAAAMGSVQSILLAAGPNSSSVLISSLFCILRPAF